MSTAVHEPHQSLRERKEQAALDQIADRMATQFPELSGEEIARAIQGRYQEFAGSSIRDFVPVLVERSVRDQLAAR